jgi:probable HAF family extracellular repeat protein
LGINNCGQAVGYAGNPTALTSYRAFIWQNGEKTLLGTVGTNNLNFAYRINDSGQVVGYYVTESNHVSSWYAYLWQNGVASNLLMATNGVVSMALDINNAGQIVGKIGFAEGGKAVLWQGSTVTWITNQNSDLAGVSAWANGINSSGRVAGMEQRIYEVGTNGIPCRAFVWEGGAWTNLTEVGGNSAARDINDNGQVVGYYGDGNYSYPNRACLWASNKVTYLGTLDRTYSIADAINSQNQAVGHVYDWSASKVNLRAFLWEDGSMVDLNDYILANEGWILECALDISDNGWIVGYGRHYGVQHGFILKPCSDVPRPGIESYSPVSPVEVATHPTRATSPFPTLGCSTLNRWVGIRARSTICRPAMT